MPQTRLTYLLKRYYEDKATPEELDEIMPIIANADNEAEIKVMMDLYWNEHAAIAPVFTSEKSKSMLTGILAVQSPKVPHSIGKNRKWLYAAAASVVLLLGMTALYNYVSKKNTEIKVVKTDNISIPGAPGGYKAILTLADASTIILDSSTNGIPSQQGKAKIVKQAKGQLAYIATDEKPGGIVFNSVTTPRGGEYEVILSDGSKAWLNAASSIRFPSTFDGTERNVEITGEVYFEVAKNAAKPFTVNVAGKGVISVLGTHFNVNAYSDETSVTTTLVEGKVKVTGIAAKVSQIISPGEQAELHANGQLNVNKNVEMEQVLAWKNGLLNFSDSDLATVLRQISRWYDVEIVFEGPIPQTRFGGELKRDINLSGIIRFLEKYNVHLRMDGKRLIVLNK